MPGCASTRTARGRRWLWGGVVAGVGLALLLAAVMLGVLSRLTGAALEYFEVGMMFVAAVLITQMVLWMRRHGRGLKRELESSAARTAQGASWAVLTLAALAVGREGAETVIFLYGLFLEQRGLALLGFTAAAMAEARRRVCHLLAHRARQPLAVLADVFPRE